MVVIKALEIGLTIGFMLLRSFQAVETQITAFEFAPCCVNPIQCPSWWCNSWWCFSGWCISWRCFCRGRQDFSFSGCCISWVVQWLIRWSPTCEAAVVVDKFIVAPTEFDWFGLAALLCF